MISNFELEMKFLEGKPITIEPNLSIHKMSFSKISDVGYYKYNKIINMLCLEQEQLGGDIDLYKYLMLTCYQCLEDKKKEPLKVTLLDELIDVLTCIFNNKVTLDTTYGCFIIGTDGLLYRNNFYEFQAIIKKRNCLESIEVDTDNPDCERTKQLLERRKQLREQVNKTKSSFDDEDGLSLLDLISIYAEAEHMMPETVFKYDMYQFNNQFNRMKIFKDYEVNVQALLAGVKNENVDIQHWLSKINKNKD